MLWILRIGETYISKDNLSPEFFWLGDCIVCGFVCVAIEAIDATRHGCLEGCRGEFKYALRCTQCLQTKQQVTLTSMILAYTFIVPPTPEETLIVYMAKDASSPPVRVPPTIMFPPTHKPHKRASFKERPTHAPKEARILDRLLSFSNNN